MNEPQYRHEFKYLLDSGTGYKLQKSLIRFGMKRDPYIPSGQDHYIVTSLYYDTYKFSDYQDKTGGFIKRKKLRIRIYENYLNKSTYATIEIKHKFDTKNYKIRMRLPRADLEALLNEGPSALIRAQTEVPASIRGEILWYLLKSSPRPVVVVTYDRIPFVTETSDLRLTFDMNIKANRQPHLNQSDFLTDVLKDQVILEVKYNYILPHWFIANIRQYDLQRVTFSKYEQSLEALYAYNPLLR